VVGRHEPSLGGAKSSPEELPGTAQARLPTFVIDFHYMRSDMALLLSLPILNAAGTVFFLPGRSN
jgi:hypothetical protein